MQALAEDKVHVRVYQCKTGRYKGLYHVRIREDGNYLHIGRYRTIEEVERVKEDLEGSDDTEGNTGACTGV